MEFEYFFFAYDKHIRIYSILNNCGKLKCEFLGVIDFEKNMFLTGLTNLFEMPLPRRELESIMFKIPMIF